MRIGVFLGTFPALSETFILDQLIGLIDRGHTLDLFPSARSDEPVHHSAIDHYGLRQRVRYVPAYPASTDRVRTALRLGLALLFRGSATPLRVLHPRYRRSGSRLPLLQEAADFPKTGPYDVLYAPFGPEGVRAARLKRLGVVSGALATAFLGYDLTQVPRQRGPGCYDLLFEEAAALLPCSETGRQRLLGLGAPADRIAVHRLGVDLHRFAFSPRTPPRDGPLRILSVARLVEKKGIAYGIRAVAALPDDLDVRYEIIGDGPLRADLEREIRSGGAGDRVRLVGPRDTRGVQAAMRTAHLFLAPSVTASTGDTEGIPVVLMEALASGLPVVSTRHSGIPELIIDGETGRLVPERDVEALTDALTAMISTPTCWPSYGTAGRAFVERHHDMHTLNDQLAARLEALTA